jgi:hypothetical protein
LPKRPSAPSAPAARAKNAKRPQGDTLAAEPNRLAAKHGLGWWREAWRLFRKATGPWIGIGLVSFLILLILLLIPYNAGGLVYLLFSPVFTAGLMLGCRSLDSGGNLTFGHLFAGFRNDFGRLLTIGAINLLGYLVIVGVTVLSAGSGSAQVAMLGPSAGFLLGIPLTISMWFAPTLVVLHGLTVLEAMKLSFRGCGLCNVLPWLLYGLVGYVLAIFAVLPLGIGLVMLIPVYFCSLYASYRDIFTNGRRP